jgi:ribulose-phosphate 3-epimerase
MVAEPERVVTDWVRVGVKRIIVHVESSKYIAAALMRGRAAAEERGRAAEFGLAINTTTDNAALDPYLNDIDFIQCMGIENIGYQGQPFDERVLAKIRALRAEQPSITISVDGGVNFETAPLLIDAGANRLVSGSAIFSGRNVSENLEMMRKVVRL